MKPETGPGPRRTGVDHRVTIGLLAPAVTVGTASCLHLNGQIQLGFTTPAPHYARIEVQDNDGPWNQAMTGPARHHGLDIIRAVADAWGIDGDHTTRTIWARFDWPEQP